MRGQGSLGCLWQTLKVYVHTRQIWKAGISSNVFVGYIVGRKKLAGTVQDSYVNSPDAISHCPIWVELKHTILHSYIMYKGIFAIHKVAVRDPQLLMHTIVQSQVLVGLIVC